MILSVKDSKLFFKLWLSLLRFVNDEYALIPNLFTKDDIPTINDLQKVQAKLVENNLIIDDFVKINDFSDSENEILSSWKNLISAKFYVLKHLSKYSIFFCPEIENSLFGVVGITSTIDEMLQYRPLPAYIDAVLLPWNDKIITTGIIAPYNISFGKGIKSELNEKYKTIKENFGIITTINLS
jgi:hypothetical protein